jgi:hypothetical protein
MKNEKKSSHKFNPNELDVLFKFDERKSCIRDHRIPDIHVMLQLDFFENYYRHTHSRSHTRSYTRRGKFIVGNISKRKR